MARRRPDHSTQFGQAVVHGRLQDDVRWDAMLAGVVEMLHLRHDLDPPAWTVGHPLDTIWWVGSVEGLHAYAFAHSPPSLHVRGVMLDPAETGRSRLGRPLPYRPMDADRARNFLPRAR